MPNFFNKYPYTDFHELNLDWVLETIKQLVTDWEEYHTSMTGEWNDMQEDWHDTEEAWISLKNYVENYFANLDVQDEINNKIDEMVADGTMDALLLPLFNTYKSQIDNMVNTQNNRITLLESRMDTFSTLAEGSTTGDAELMDARIGANGITYPNAGDAIRGQITDVMNIIQNESGLDIIEFTEGYRIPTNTAPVDINNPIATSGWSYAVVDCTAGDQFTIINAANSTNANYAFLDSSNNVIIARYSANINNTPLIATAPDNALKLVINAIYLSPNIRFAAKGIASCLSIKKNSDDILKITGCSSIPYVPETRIMTNSEPVSINANNASGFSTAVVACSPGDKFTVAGYGAAGSYLATFIDNAGHVLDYLATGSSDTTYYFLTAPDDAAYLISNVITTWNHELYYGYVQQANVENIMKLNWWSGKKVVTFGDSLTEYDGETFAPTHSEAGQTCIGYQQALRDMGCIVSNLGMSGATMPGILTKISLEFDVAGEWDLATINAGANDFRNGSEQIGTIQPIGSVFDTTTYIGALQAAIEHIMSVSPQTKIIIITPLKGWNHGVLMPEAYPQAFMNVAKLYSLPVCNWYYDSGINDANMHYYIGDDDDQTGYNLHPTNAGFKELGHLLSGILKTH